MKNPDRDRLDLIRAALAEDVGTGDITSAGALEVKPVKGIVVAKSKGVLSGSEVFRQVFQVVDSVTQVTMLKTDGDSFTPSDKIAELEGFNFSLLISERTALNFMGHLSGIASLTRSFVDRIEHTKAVILDTRKTTPGLRLLEKQAVAHGGGQNHRLGLYDMVLIKDNHIASTGSITKAVENTRDYLDSSDFETQHRVVRKRILIEVEVTNEDQVIEAIRSGVDRLLLDNQSAESLRKLVNTARQADPRVKLEASGNVNLDSVAAIAETGVDYISVGAITHSAPVSDFSMKLID